MKKIINKIPWPLTILATATLGLAPFTPPHFFEKLGMLFSGNLVKLVDWLDLALHGTPWLLLLTKLALLKSKETNKEKV